MKYFKNFILLAVVFIGLKGKAQSNLIFDDIDANFKLAKQYYINEQYSLAYGTIKKLYSQSQQNSQFPEHLINEVNYYYLSTALILDEVSVEEKAKEYIKNSNNVARSQMLNYQIGEFYYRQKKYNKVIETFSKQGIENLTNAEIATLKFHKAYSHFALQQFKEAKTLFNTTRQLVKDPNYIDANYYYGFICFYDKQYNEALQSFMLVQNDIVYENVVPFYIAEIYYFLNDKDKALKNALDALNKPNAQVYDLELRELVGHLYFDKKEYDNALPFLEYYVNKSEKVRREDLYQLAFCYYSAKQWEKCIDGFKELGGKQDSLAQNSMYLLADAYLKTNQKANARNAFLFCASNSSNAIQKEVSSFNYAKLSQELGYLDIAIKEYQSFLVEYPKSLYVKETKELMFIALANTSNYKDALEIFKDLDKTETVKKTYPKVLYARATELINERRLDIADSLLSILIKAPYSSLQLPLANFWKGEIAYRNGNTDDAIVFYKNYISSSINSGDANLNNAKYNLGYCLLKKEIYNEALKNFESIGTQIYSNSSAVQQDAYLRTADCYFMTKQFNSALKMYDNVINQNLKTADYATYQKAVIMGASGKSKEKINLLESLPKAYPNSALAGEALMEMANTFIANEDYRNAIDILEQITSLKSASSFYPQAYLKIGVAYFNTDKNEEALKNFSYLSKQYPNTQEAEESIEYIRNIFIETQRPEEFINFMKQNGKLITYSEEDSLTYRAALLRFQAEDTASAIKLYQNYLYKFSDGKYCLQANYIVAEIFIDNKNKLGALPYYEVLANKAPNKYAERSALQTARIYYFEKQDYTKALQYFAQTKQLATQQENILEAMRGLLRCQYKKQLWNEAEPNAKELLTEKGIANDDKMMATLIIAKSNEMKQKYEDAILAYKQALSISKNEFSAEANYKIAEIQFIQNKLPESEKTAFDAIKKFGSYEYWVVKNYLLLGDIYFKQKDYFNAEATFKSIIENTTIQELKEEANKKLLAVVEEKNKDAKVENN